MQSLRHYVEVEELGKITSKPVKLDLLIQAEEDIDSLIPYNLDDNSVKRKFFSEIKFSETIVDWSNTCIKLKGKNYENDYFKQTLATVIGGSKYDTHLFITHSINNVLYFKKTKGLGNMIAPVRIHQVGKFPRLIDAGFNINENAFIREIPQPIKQAVVMQYSFLNKKLDKKYNIRIYPKIKEMLTKDGFSI